MRAGTLTSETTWRWCSIKLCQRACLTATPVKDLMTCLHMWRHASWALRWRSQSQMESSIWAHGRVCGSVSIEIMLAAGRWWWPCPGVRATRRCRRCRRRRARVRSGGGARPPTRTHTRAPPPRARGGKPRGDTFYIPAPNLDDSSYSYLRATICT